jgi:hypothetical protein
MIGILAAALWWSAAASAAEPPLPPEIEVAVEAAAVHGVPVEALEKKAREGLAKGVPPDRIAEVLTGLGREFAAAQMLVPPGDPELVPAAAAASRAGASREAILEVLTFTPAPLQAVSLWTLADLLNTGLRESSALRLVRSAVGANKPEYGLRGLASATAALLASGASEQAAVAEVADAVEHGRSPLAALPGGNGGPPEHANNGGNGNAGNAHGADKRSSPKRGS